MKWAMIGAASSLWLCACGADVVLRDGGGGSSELGASGASATPEMPGAGSGGSAASDTTAPPDCSVSPASYQSYTSPVELNDLLIGQWRRCIDPQLPGEDIGVEFTADGKFYPLTSDSTQQVVRRTGVDFEGSWVYSPPGSEDPVSHGASEQGFMMLNQVITSPPRFTNDPRQMRILFSPVLSKYVPLAR